MSSEEARQTVQKGLERRAAESRRKEADLEAQARKLRATINDNHTTRTLTEVQRKAMEQEQREARRTARMEAKARERAREDAAVMAVKRYSVACAGIMLVTALTPFPWWAAMALIPGLAVFPTAYIYRLYVPIGGENK